MTKHSRPTPSPSKPTDGRCRSRVFKQAWSARSSQPEPRPGSAPRFVPKARAGTVFNLGLLRNRGHMVGPKGAGTKIAAFKDALAALQSKPEPLLSRPDEAGSWGIVRGVECRRLDQSDLDVIASLGRA